MPQDEDPSADRSPRRWSPRRILLFLVPLFLFYIFPLGFWPISIGANESTHSFLALAMYQRGTTSVNDEVRDYFFNHDLVYRDGNFYSNKAPGPAFLLVPAAFLIDIFTPGRVELVQLIYFGRILMLTLPFIFFLFLMGRTLENFASPAMAWGLTLAYALGTSASVYAIQYFAHNLAAMAMGIGFLLAFSDSYWKRLMAGIACGFGVICEYQTLGIAVVITILAILGKNRRVNLKFLATFAFGALLLVGALLLYNRATFKSTFEVGYESEFKFFGLSSSSLYGFSFPSIMKLGAMTFSPALGLFFHSPWLLLFIPAAVASLFMKALRTPMIIGAVLTSAVLPLTISSHEYWIGGSIAGPRYLTAGLPFLLFPIAAFADRARGRWRLTLKTILMSTALMSIGLFACIIASTPYIETDRSNLFQNPLAAFAFPLLERGATAFTLANYFNADVPLSMFLYIVLLGLVVGGYAIPYVFRSDMNTRLAALGSGLLGLALFILWMNIGKAETHLSKKHLGRLTNQMLLANQPREDGRYKLMKRPTAVPPKPMDFSLQAYDSTLESLVSRRVSVYKIAEHFMFIKDAVWHRDGYLVCSDPRNNTLYKYTPDGSTLSVFRNNSGMSGPYFIYYREPGVNGIALDRKGRLTLAEYGRRRVTRLEKNGNLTVLVDRFQNKRLNCPSNLVYRSDGTLFFTDPPFGLNNRERDSLRELWFSGIYRLKRGKLKLLTNELQGPAGLAFSPDEKYLYVGEWKAGKKTLMRFEVDAKGNLSGRRTLVDMSTPPFSYPTDGLLVDRRGTLYVTGNGGVWILSPEGKRIGFLELPRPVLSLAWGEADGKTLFLAAGTELFEMRVLIPGIMQ